MPFSFRLHAYLWAVLGHFPRFYVLISKSEPSLSAKWLSKSMNHAAQCKIRQEIYFSSILSMMFLPFYKQACQRYLRTFNHNMSPRRKKSKYCRVGVFVAKFRKRVCLYVWGFFLIILTENSTSVFRTSFVSEKWKKKNTFLVSEHFCLPFERDFTEKHRKERKSGEEW